MRKCFLLFFMLVASSLQAFSQTRQISGKVSDKRGETLVGITLTQKNLINYFISILHDRGQSHL